MSHNINSMPMAQSLSGVIVPTMPQSIDVVEFELPTVAEYGLDNDIVYSQFYKHTQNRRGQINGMGTFDGSDGLLQNMNARENKDNLDGAIDPNQQRAEISSDYALCLGDDNGSLLKKYKFPPGSMTENSYYSRFMS